MKIENFKLGRLVVLFLFDFGIYEHKLDTYYNPCWLSQYMWDFAFFQIWNSYTFFIEEIKVC